MALAGSAQKNAQSHPKVHLPEITTVGVEVKTTKKSSTRCIFRSKHLPHVSFALLYFTLLYFTQLALLYLTLLNFSLLNFTQLAAALAKAHLT
jgi:hypothetical protein